jgi:hypothetical protein
MIVIVVYVANFIFAIKSVGICVKLCKNFIIMFNIFIIFILKTSKLQKYNIKNVVMNNFLFFGLQILIFWM